MHLDVFLSLFTLMLVSLAVYILSKRLRVPYTVLLVVAGSFLVPISQIEFKVLKDISDITNLLELREYLENVCPGLEFKEVNFPGVTGLYFTILIILMSIL